MNGFLRKIPATFRASLLAVLLLICSGFTAPTGDAGGNVRLPGDIKTGDIIFQQSSSRQATALEQATHSRWTHTGIILRRNDEWVVAEASATVRYTPIRDFISKGKGHRFVIKRLKKSPFKKGSDAAGVLTAQLSRYLGKPYDIYFRWDDGAIYCSELVWKAYRPLVTLSEPQRMKDMDLTALQVKRLIEERYPGNGTKFNLNERVVTPVAIFNSSKLFKVYDSAD